MTTSRSAPGATFLWFALGLLIISICINYIDRGNLSVASSAIQKDFSLDAERMGLLLSAFFWTYSTAQLFAGAVIDRFNVNWVYAAGYFLWSGATILTGYTTGFESLFLLRMVLGLSESVAYPCYSKIIAGGFREEQRGVANALIDAGSKLGPAIGIFICAKLLAWRGWQMMFIVIGAVSMLWLIPWIWVAMKQRVEKVEVKASSISVVDIITTRAAWGTFLALLCGNYTWYFMLTWLPSYLKNVRHYTDETMAIAGSAPFLAVAISSTICGILSDRWIRGGGSPTRVRKTFAASGLACAAAFLLPSAMVEDPKISMGLLICASAAFGMWSSNLWAITQTLAGPGAAGRWTGLQNAFGNLAGIVAPWLTGWSIKATESYLTGFAIAAGVAACGAITYAFLLPQIRPVFDRR